MDIIKHSLRGPPISNSLSAGPVVIYSTRNDIILTNHRFSISLSETEAEQIKTELATLKAYKKTK